MADKFEFKLDRGGVGMWMRADLQGIVAQATEKVAGNVRSAVAANPPQSGTAQVLTSTGVNRNGRPFGLVTIAHPYGQALQAKHGVLTKAVAAAGLDFRAY